MQVARARPDQGAGQSHYGSGQERCAVHIAAPSAEAAEAAQDAEAETDAAADEGPGSRSPTAQVAVADPDPTNLSDGVGASIFLRGEDQSGVTPARHPSYGWSWLTSEIEADPASFRKVLQEIDEIAGLLRGDRSRICKEAEGERRQDDGQ